MGYVWRGQDQIRGSRVDHFGSADGLSSNTVYGFFQDSEGNIWVATTQGVDCFRDIPVVSFSMREGLSADNPVSVLVAHDGTVWVGNTGGLDTIRNGMTSSIRAVQGLPGNQVTSLFEDRDRRLWVGVDDRLWIYRDQRFSEIRRADGGHVGTVRQLRFRSIMVSPRAVVHSAAPHVATRRPSQRREPYEGLATGSARRRPSL